MSREYTMVESLYNQRYMLPPKMHANYQVIQQVKNKPYCTKSTIPNMLSTSIYYSIIKNITVMFNPLYWNNNI